MYNKINEKEIQKMLIENKLANSENNLKRIPYDHVLRLLNKIRNGSYHEITFPEFGEIKENAGVSASEKKTLGILHCQCYFAFYSCCN